MVQMSPEQALYLKKKKWDTIQVYVLRILLLPAFICLWEWASHTKRIDSFIFSSPSLILQNLFWMLKTQQLAEHIFITVIETLISFLLVVLCSMLFAILLWSLPKAARILEPYLVVLNSLPKSALAPLLIVWLGANQRTIIVAGMSVALFGSVISLYTGFSETDTDKIKLIQTLGGTKKDVLFKIILPSSAMLIVSTMKVNIGLCLVGVIIGEFIGARQGLGYLIIYGSQTFKLTWVLMSIVLLCIISMLLYGFLSIIEYFFRKSEKKM